MVQNWAPYIDSGTLGWVDALNSVEQQRVPPPAPTQQQRQQPQSQAAVSGYDAALGMGQSYPVAEQYRDIKRAIEAERLYNQEIAQSGYNPLQEYNQLAERNRRQQVQQTALGQASDIAVMPSRSAIPGQTLADFELSLLNQTARARPPSGSLYDRIAGEEIPLLRELRDVASSTAGTVGNVAGNVIGGIPGQVVPFAAKQVGVNLPNAGDVLGTVGREVTRAVVPTRPGELVLEAIPGVGFGPDAVRAARRAVPEFGDVIRRGVDAYRFPEEAPTFLYHGTSTGRVPAIAERGLNPLSWLSPNIETAQSVARNQALMRGESPAVLRFPVTPEQVQRARTTFARRPAYRVTQPLFGGQARLSTGIAGGADDLTTQLEKSLEALGAPVPPRPPRTPLRPGDPGYSHAVTLDEMLANEAGMPPLETLPEVPNVSRYVTQPDGSRVSATPVTIRNAVERFMSRRTSRQFQSIRIDKPQSPEDFINQLAEAVINTRTRGGAKLLDGVSPSEVRNVIASMSDRVGAVPTKNGVVPVMDDGINLPKAVEEATREPGLGRPRTEFPAQELPPGQAPLLGDDVVRTTRAGEQVGAQRPLSIIEELQDVARLPDTPQGIPLNAQRLNRALIEQGGTPNLSGGMPPTPPRGPRDPKQPDLPGFQPGRNYQAALWDVFKNVWNLPRSFVTAVDFSYPLRQGFLMVRHGKEWADAFQTGFRSLFDEDLARRTMAEIASKDRGTLHISPLEGGKLLDREEEFASRFVGKIPLLRQSQRAATVFINKLRADVYDTVTSSWLRRGQEPTQKDFETLGNYLNRATGRGNLGNFENAAAELATGLFSPRLMAARIQAPGYLLSSSSLVRQEAFKDFLTAFGGAGALLTLAHQSGFADVTLDPRSSDFLKMKIGKTRVDLLGGYQQMARLVGQLYTGEYKSEAGDIYPADAPDTIFRFLRSKASPGTSMFIDSLEGRNFLGQELSLAPDAVKREFYNRLFPLAIQDLIEAIEEDGAVGGVLAASALFGTGVSAYQSDQAKLGDLISGKFRDASTGETYTRWSQLSGPQKEEARKANPEIDAILKGREEQAMKEGTASAIRKQEYQEAWSELQRTADFDKYFETAGNISEKFRLAISEDTFPEVKNPSDFNQKVTAFFDQQAEEVNPDKQEENERKFRAGLSDAEEAAFDEVLLNSVDPNYEFVKRTNDQLQREFYDERDAVWQIVRKEYPELQSFETYSDVFEELPSNHPARGLAGNIIANWEKSLYEQKPEVNAIRVLLGHTNELSSQQSADILYAILQETGIDVDTFIAERFPQRR